MTREQFVEKRLTIEERLKAEQKRIRHEAEEEALRVGAAGGAGGSVWRVWRRTALCQRQGGTSRAAVWLMQQFLVIWRA